MSSPSSTQKQEVAQNLKENQKEDPKVNQKTNQEKVTSSGTQKQQLYNRCWHIAFCLPSHLQKVYWLMVLGRNLVWERLNRKKYLLASIRSVLRQ